VTATLKWLVGSPGLQLRAWWDESGEDSELERRLRMPVTWVHSSDLLDPSPFLRAGNLLLTDGSQFGLGSLAEDFDYEPYLERLAGNGIVGLGLATHFLHAGMPESLAAACQKMSFPLIEVSDQVPFIAIIRRVAEYQAKERMSRLEWSVSAQKAISRAALKPNGLESILAELERQLDCWVAMFDSLGHRILVPAVRQIPPEIADLVAEGARSVLKTGSRTGSSFVLDANQITMQTLGQRDALRGVLALGRGATLDRSENELLTSVIALASLALEQNRALDAARSHLRAGLLELLIGGNVAVATRSAEQLWGRMPQEPISIFELKSPQYSQHQLDTLELLCEVQTGGTFFALRNGVLVIISENASIGSVEAVLKAFEAPVGVSVEGHYSSLQELLGQARMAREAAETRFGKDQPFIRFSAISETGVLGFLRSEKAEHLARRVLEPLVGYDQDNDTDIASSIEVWLRNECHWDQSALELGVHRHTLRNRINQANEILGLDLNTFAGRLEAWTAFQLLTAE
jgi:purine catabolism regulator